MIIIIIIIITQKYTNIINSQSHRKKKESPPIMNPSPHLPFLSPLLLLLLLPTLPVQAWFVRLLLSSSAHRQTKTQIDLFFFFFPPIQNCVQGSLNSGAGRCLGNGPDFPLKFTCHLVRFFGIHRGANSYAEKRKQRRKKEKRKCVGKG